MARAPIHIGTSGWNYSHWRGPFYAPHLRERDMLAEYARHLDAVEINSTFYNLPKAATLEHWAKQVPADFRFAVKASRYITHIKKLKDSADTVASLLERIRVLGDRLGPILFQLPPRFRYNADRLQALLDALPTDLDCTLELRDGSWLNDDAFARLADRGAALCLDDYGGREVPEQVTGGFLYVRLHGSEGAYQGAYADAALDRWAAFLRDQADAGHPAWCFFDNDVNGHAPNDALRLAARLT